jgi:hypothetical protein
MHFKRKGVVTKKKRNSNTMLLDEYELCLECQTVWVKKTYKTFKYEPYCQECRQAIRNSKKKENKAKME